MRVVLLSALMLMSVGAEAEWTFITTGSNDGSEFFIDLSTVKKTKEGYRRGWELMNASKGLKSSNGIYKSVKALRLIDCDEERSRSLSETYFSGEMGKGEVLSERETPGPWDFIAPDTVGRRIADAVCSRR